MPLLRPGWPGSSRRGPDRTDQTRRNPAGPVRVFSADAGPARDERGARLLGDGVDARHEGVGAAGKEATRKLGSSRARGAEMRKAERLKREPRAEDRRPPYLSPCNGRRTRYGCPAPVPIPHQRRGGPRTSRVPEARRIGVGPPEPSAVRVTARRVRVRSRPIQRPARHGTAQQLRTTSPSVRGGRRGTAWSPSKATEQTSSLAAGRGCAERRPWPAILGKAALASAPSW